MMPSMLRALIIPALALVAGTASLHAEEAVSDDQSLAAAEPQDVFIVVEAEPVLGADPVESDPDGYYQYDLKNVQDTGVEPPDGDMTIG